MWSECGTYKTVKARFWPWLSGNRFTLIPKLSQVLYTLHFMDDMVVTRPCGLAEQLTVRRILQSLPDVMAFSLRCNHPRRVLCCKRGVFLWLNTNEDFKRRTRGLQL